ncbi:PREDICTED: arylsulfatase B-like [Dinoponera quadriceps]|uniref:Arylsulfatase B-like n=1 Tax=Dinoponera quadriceps TaxID=609295 RepID=A0A6P3WXL6_DINQU|nr:PREDICTED: arylsulfatase B-like [Dinoponera quadriceps]
MNEPFLLQLLFTLCLLYTLIPVALLENGTTEGNDSKKPHIIIILADDLGWNDVSFHGSDQIPTPNIDALAYYGIILNNHYVSPMCTPSRSALMTGKYPIHTGMQHYVIRSAEPRGLPLTEKLMPEYLKEMSYSTNMVGKWHLGFYKHEYTPLWRGFDSFFGLWNGLQDYFSHETVDPFTNFRGMDMRRNMEVAWDTKGNYSTDLYTKEAVRLINAHNPDKPLFLYLAHLAVHSGNEEQLLQAPPEEIEKFSYIDDPNRKTYAAMVSKLDDSVGQVVEALKNRGMLDNSIILFMSDNGAPTHGFLNNYGSNYPFRGIKNTAWEGAVRGVAAIWSPLIKKRERVSNHLMCIADWLPTLLSAAGGSKEKIGKIDGLDMWPTIVSDEHNPREEVLINIDKTYQAIRNRKYKYVHGQTKESSKWLGDNGRSPTETRPLYPPETVLHSKAGAAIASVTKNTAELNSQKILQLRQQAEIHCNVTEKEQVACHASLMPCLFDLERDPCEKMNIIAKKTYVAQKLEAVLKQYKSTMLQPNNKNDDLKANPIRWNHTWVCWQDPNPNATICTNKIDSYVGKSITIAFCTFGVSLILVFFFYELYKSKKCVSHVLEQPRKRSLKNKSNDVRKEEESYLIELRPQAFCNGWHALYQTLCTEP